MKRPYCILLLRGWQIEIWHFRMTLSAILSAMGY
jgi:hypothetical protein